MTQKKVLVCPLDWGLGHASRCVPLIKLLIDRNHQVILGGSGPSLDLLKDHFPSLPLIPLKQFHIRYAPAPFFWIFLAMQMPVFLLSVIMEHRMLRNIIKKEKIDLVISDNRYGLFSSHASTVFITHQLHLILPFPLVIFETLAETIIRWTIRQFNQCWIPDLEDGENLSGVLSHVKRKPGNVYFIGILSRFSGAIFTEPSPGWDFDLVATISGPEPHRSELEKILVTQLSDSGFKSLLIRGLPGQKNLPAATGNLTIADHLSDKELAEALLRAKYLICRGGYTTIMDLAALGKMALLVPTPGQTEQEYLADKLSRQGYFPFLSQDQFSLEKAISLLDEFSQKPPLHTKGSLSETITPELIDALTGREDQA